MAYGTEDDYRDWESSEELKGRRRPREGEIHVGPTTQWLCAWCGPTTLHGRVELVGGTQLCPRHAIEARLTNDEEVRPIGYIVTSG